MKYEVKEMELSQVISEACDRLSELGDEMQEAFDNTPKGLQGSAIGEARQEAADQLTGLDKPSYHESLEAIKVKVNVPVRTVSAARRLSRSDRRDDAVALLRAALETLQESESFSGVDELVSDLEQLIDDAEAVEFPGRSV